MLSIRPIQAQDNPAIAKIIRTVLTDFGANREGFAFADPELDTLSEAFPPPRSGYWVLSDGETIWGGAGFGPLIGGDPTTAELKKMYFLPGVRGQGYGRQFMALLLEQARLAGYRQIYLETTGQMLDAIRLYERSGFTRIPEALGATGHFGCEVRMLRDL